MQGRVRKSAQAFFLKNGKYLHHPGFQRKAIGNRPDIELKILINDQERVVEFLIDTGFQVTLVGEDFEIERGLPINVGLCRKITQYFAIKLFILRYNLEPLEEDI